MKRERASFGNHGEPGLVAENQRRGRVFCWLLNEHKVLEIYLRGCSNAGFSSNYKISKLDLPTMEFGFWVAESKTERDE